MLKKTVMVPVLAIGISSAALAGPQVCDIKAVDSKGVYPIKAYMKDSHKPYNVKALRYKGKPMLDVKVMRKGRVSGDVLLLKSKRRGLDDVKALTRSGRVMDIKASLEGRRLGIKAIRPRERERVLAIKALDHGKPVAVKAFCNDGEVLDVKGLPYAQNPGLQIKEGSVGRVKAFRSAPVLARKLRR